MVKELKRKMLRAGLFTVGSIIIAIVFYIMPYNVIGLGKDMTLFIIGWAVVSFGFNLGQYLLYETVMKLWEVGK